jgi:DHA2 family multidrug resistance protein
VSPRYPDLATRRLITAGCMLSTIMVALDGTIANVALPHMQSTMMASQEQISWVLTSYIIASAVMTPLSGWLAQRFGRKRVMLLSALAFTVASLACGLATNLEEMVLFRLLQGMGGAGLVPLSQSTMFDINPPEKHGQAMALYGMGSVLGPIVGPTLGGWLTDAFSWHWIFLINLPIGVMAGFLLAVFSTETAPNESRFDLTGFALLAITVSSLQLMLDRGQLLDWFDSREIAIEATVAAAFAYLMAVHMFLTPRPFIPPGLFTDRNFVIGCTISLAHGMLIFAVMVMLAPMLQQLMGYSATQTGLVTAPRGLGTMTAMYVAGRLVGRIDARWIVVAGLGLAAASLYLMAHFTLMMGWRTIVAVGVLQGLGAGSIFVPLSALMFSTLDPRLRNEGAALFSLSRYMGAAVGISVLQTMTVRNSAAVHSRLVEGLRPDNPILALRDPDADFLAAWIARMDVAVVREATAVAYVDAFWLLAGVMLVVLPLTFVMRGDGPRRIRDERHR